MFGLSVGLTIAIIVVALLLFYFGGKRLFKILKLLWAVYIQKKGRIATITATVDGDTIRVTPPKKSRNQDPIAVRMIGVNTPESRKSMYMDIQPYGFEAAYYTKKRFPNGKKVILIYDVEPKDKYGRDLAYVYTMTGEFYNATLVRKGFAWASRHKPNVRYAKYLESLQKIAQDKQRHLWKIYDTPSELRSSYLKSDEYKEFKKRLEKITEEVETKSSSKKTSSSPKSKESSPKKTNANEKDKPKKK